MNNNIPESTAVLAHLATCFMDTNPASIRALKLLFEELDPLLRQVYVVNLKKMLPQYPLFNMRSNEKTYAQVNTLLNEILKESFYKVRRS